MTRPARRRFGFLCVAAIAMHGCSGFAGVLPCEQQNAAFAQAPTPGEQIPVRITTITRLRVPADRKIGDLIDIALDGTIPAPAELSWSVDGQPATPKTLRPSGPTAVGVALAGEHVVVVTGQSAVLQGGAVQLVIVNASADVGVTPPEPPKPISQLITGETATKLATLYRLIATLPPPEDFWASHDKALADRAIVLTADAVKALHARLDGLEPPARNVELTKIADELAKPPGPTPDPVPVAGLRVLVVEESLDRGKLPAAQIPVIAGTKVRNYVTKGGGIFRVVDVDDDVSKLAPEWQKLRSNVTLPSPAWAVYTTKGGTVAPLPATEDAAIAELQKVAQ